MAKREEIPQWALDAAGGVHDQLVFTKAANIQAIARALLKAREEAFTEADQILEGWLCRTCGHIGTVEHDGCNSWNIDAATPEEMRAAIRQHSQKGER